MIAVSKAEREVLDSLLNAYPGFLSENLQWESGANPPDFVGTSVSGERFGLELTEWLIERQTTTSISNVESRMRLLGAIASERAGCPSPIVRVVICDRLDAPFRARDRQSYVREIYQFVEQFASRWTSDDPTGSWPVRDLSAYPTLARYCHSITLYGPPYNFTSPSGHALYGPGKRWIEFEPVGGVYDPQWAVDALISRIKDKTAKYQNIHRAQNITHFALLAHYGIRGIMHNTPYKSRSVGLEDAAMQAHQCFLTEHGAFDSAYLYMNFNGGKLVRLFPEFITLKEYSHQPGQH